MKSIIFFLWIPLILLTISCKNPKSTIEKDLNTRYTKFEIVEVKADSANIYEAYNLLNELKVQIPQMNQNILCSLDSIGRGVGEKTPKQYYLYMNSLYKEMENKLSAFEASKTHKPDKCFYVKYLVENGAIKETVEEYYYLDEKNGVVIHRPIDWDAFLKSVKYTDYVNDYVKYYKYFLKIERVIPYYY